MYSIDFLIDQKSIHRDSLLRAVLQIPVCDSAAGHSGSSSTGYMTTLLTLEKVREKNPKHFKIVPGF